jgi:hypothetical protein
MASLRVLQWLPACLLFASIGISLGQDEPTKPAGKPDVRYPALLAAKPLQEDSKDDELRKLLKARYNAVLAEARDYYRIKVASGERERPSFEDWPDNEYGRFKRLVRAGLEAFDKPADKVALVSAYLEMTKGAEKDAESHHKAGHYRIGDVERARYERLDAEAWLIRLKREASVAKDK